MTSRLRPRSIGVACIGCALAVGGCGSSSSSGPPQEQLAPRYAGLGTYKHRCNEITTRGAIAQVVYEPSQNMTRGDTATVTAAVTLNRSVLPNRVLQSSGAVAAPAIVVSCVIEAQLSGSGYDFNVDNRAWVPRSFLTADTARWTWYVGPKIGGTQTLVLNVRPIVNIHTTRSSSSFVTAETADVQQYPIKVHVNVPWTERPAEVMSRLAATFKVAQGLVEATTALLVAVSALLGFVLHKRSRSKRAASAANG